MTPPDDDPLPVPQGLAVAYSPRSVRPAMRALLAFDAHLARLVAGTREPLLGQMRLAWWREELGKPASERARRNPELEAIGAAWTGEETALVELIDGWENLLGEAPLQEDSVAAFAAARGNAFGGLARLADEAGAVDAARAAGRRWALADFAARVSDPAERARARTLYAAGDERPVRLPRALRGLAVLDGLARRALAREAPLMAGRGAALAALRLGLFGR